MIIRERQRLCEACGYNLTAAEIMGEGAERLPRPGDVSMCWNCCAGYVMARNGKWRPITSAEVRRLPPELQQDLGRALALRMLKGAPPPDRAGHG